MATNDPLLDDLLRSQHAAPGAQRGYEIAPERLPPPGSWQPRLPSASTRPHAPRVTRQRKESAIFQHQSIRIAQPWLDRLVGFVLLCGSFLGSVTMLNGWTSPWTWAPIQWGLFATGMALQTMLTLYQWSYSPAHNLMDAQGRRLRGIRRGWRLARQLRWRYLIAVLIGAGTSVAGYAPVIWEHFFGFVRNMGLAPSYESVVTWATIAVLALAIEATPEIILIDD